MTFVPMIVMPVFIMGAVVVAFVSVVRPAYVRAGLLPNSWKFLPSRILEEVYETHY